MEVVRHHDVVERLAGGTVLTQLEPLGRHDFAGREQHEGASAGRCQNRPPVMGAERDEVGPRA
ncbi:MAG: hypothetical protein ACREL2_06365 [Gemmatimonadales bacterium]